MKLEAAITRYMDVHAPPNTVKREVRAASPGFINAIVGPRRAGKTTYMLQLRDTIKQPQRNKVFLNCEDINLVGLRMEDLDQLEKTWLRVYSPDASRNIFLFIDEVQNIPGWEKWLRTLHDYGRYRIFVSGSTSELSTSKMHSALRGRALNTTILPFSFSELLAARGLEYSRYMTPEREGKIASLFDEYVEYGGYPAVVLSETSQQKLTLLREIYETVVQRDMIERRRIRRIAEFRLVMAAMMGSVCRQVSIRKLAAWAGSQGVTVGRQTVLDYLESAEEVFFFYRLPRYSKKPRERAVNPKLYCVDSGFLHLSSLDRSKMLENQVFVELIRRGAKPSYWMGNSRREVDFAVELDGKLGLIQVADSISGPETFQRETEALKEASGALRAEKMTIITRGEERELQLGSRKVLVVPAWKWFLGIGGS